MIAKSNGKFITSNMDITKFSPSEFKCKCGCGKALMQQKLIDKLHLLRLVINKPIIITSGYRCKNNPNYYSDKKNKKISKHSKGMAADIKIKGMKSKQLVIYIERSGIDFGGLGMYENQNFAHVDIRKNKTRWTRLKSGQYVKGEWFT